MSLTHLRTPVWRQRLALFALVIGSLLVGIWADVSVGRKPDYLDLRTAVIAFLLSWVPAEMARNAINTGLHVQPKFARWVRAAVIGIISVAIAYALPAFISSLIVFPAVMAQLGLSFLADIAMGLVLTLQQALIPTLVIGSLSGVVAAWVVAL